MDCTKLLNDIDRLYPPERLARSKARLNAAWHLQPPGDRLAYVFLGLPAAEGAPTVDVWDGLHSNEELLRGQLEMIIDRAALDDDYIPSLYPGCRQGALPTAFGAQEVRSADHTWVLPLLRDAQDVYALRQPNWRTDGVAAELLERIRFFRSATQGRLPIQLPDMQGPLDLANNMWATEPLLLAMYTDPDAVHHLLSLMTEAYIAFVRLVEEAAEGDLVPIHCMPVVWMPCERGVALSEDMLAVISPKLYPTFGVPYNARIAEAFGGVVIHSCGSVEHNLTLLAGTRGLTGVNFGASETSLPAVAAAVRGKATILSHMGAVTCGSLPRLTPQEHIALCARTFRAGTFHEPGVAGIILVNPLDMKHDEALALSREVAGLLL